MIVLRSFKSLLSFYLKMLLIAKREVLKVPAIMVDLFISPCSSVTITWCGQKLMSLFSFWALTQNSAAHMCVSVKNMGSLWTKFGILWLFSFWGFPFVDSPPTLSSCSSCPQIYLVFFQVSKTESINWSLPSSQKP